MMRLLKNKEVRGALLWQLSVAVIACSLCFWFDLRAGLTAVVLSLLLMLIFCISTYKRYQRISSLADDINQVLHGDSSIDFDNYSEGELSILHSEIYKMTVRLREQQQKLIKRQGISGGFLSRHIPPDPHTADLDKSAGRTAVGIRSDR